MMTDDEYHDPHGIVHTGRVVKTVDNIERLDEIIDELSIDIEVMREKTQKCHEQMERLRGSAHGEENGV